MKHPRRIAFAIAGGVALLVCLESMSIGGQGEADKLPRPAKKTAITHDSFRIDNCVACHGRKKDNPAEYLVRCVESEIWLAQDKHKDAWTVLKGTRAQKMASILKYKVEEDARCLSCHGAVVNTQNADQMKTLERFGVNCAVCHGPYEEWYDIHQGVNPARREQWRRLPRAEKDQHWGMVDLWNPVRRAEICGSCHVGNVTENKVVTHEMYAAGHPPLPGFEPATFSQQMPPHWQSLKEKQRTNPRALEFLKIGSEDIELEQVHLVAAGALVTLRLNASLIGEQAGKGSDHWPELSVFDCYACHHDLQSSSWRQQRGFRGRPGRPHMRSWPTALGDVGLLYAARADRDRAQSLGKELDDRLAALTRTFDAQPFGDPARVHENAGSLVRWLDGVIAEANAKNRFPSDLSRKLLSRLEPSAPSVVPDFDSARQLGWAFSVLRKEAQPAWNPQGKTAVAWRSLNDNLGLQLPDKKTSIAELTAAQTEFYLQQSLRNLNNYDPAQFRKDMRMLLAEP